MPNRILRDWTDSEVIDSLDVHAERFFTRLIMKVDDFGRYQSNIKLLKSHLFPLKSDVRETDITRWLTACEQSGLIALYTVAEKGYLQIGNFKQVLRQKIEKYPGPSNATQMTSGCYADASLKRNEVETEEEVETNVIGDKSPQSKIGIEERELIFYESLIACIDTYEKEMLRKFYDYWREPNKSKTKMKWEQEKTWDLNLRLKRWSENDFNKNQPNGIIKRFTPNDKQSGNFALLKHARETFAAAQRGTAGNTG